MNWIALLAASATGLVLLGIFYQHIGDSRDRRRYASLG